MSKPIKPLNHFSITTTVTGIYDEEAMTALELAGRTAAKVNEAVEKVNEIGERIDGIESDTIPAAVAAEFTKNVNNGAFDEMVEAHTGELTQRIDNLENSYTEGSTTADAELFDIRANGDGQTYATAGASTRSTYGVAKTAIDFIATAAKNKAFTMTGTPTSRAYEIASVINGETGDIIKPNSGDTSYKTGLYYVDELSYYFINAKSNYGNGVFAAFDGSGKLLDIYRAAEGVDITEYEGYYFTPKNTAYIVCGWHETSDNYVYVGKCYKVDNISINEDLRLIPSVVNEFNRLIDSGTGAVYKVTGDPVPVEVSDQFIINEYGELVGVGLSTTLGYKVARANVTEGKLYHIHANANWGNLTYAIYDVDGNVLVLGDASADTTEYTRKDGIITTPANAAYILFAYNENTEVGLLQENIKLSPADNAGGGGESDVSKPWAGKKWVCFGDSLTEKNNRASKNYHDYIAEETGIEVVNKGYSGAGYATESDPIDFYTIVFDWLEGDMGLIYSDNPVSTEEIIISFFGSFNDLKTLPDNGGMMEYGNADSHSGMAISGKILSAIDLIYEHLPNAKIFIITPTPWDTVNPMNATNRDHEYIELLIDIARKYGIPCLDLYHTSGMRPWDETYRQSYYSKDDGNGVHPDENGHKIIAAQVRELLKKLI